MEITSYLIDFEPVGRSGVAPGDESLLEIARRLGVGLVTICDGKGTCGKCKIQVLAGDVSSPTIIERRALSKVELGKGYRLACQTHPRSELKIYIPPESLSAPVRAQVESLEVLDTPDPVGQAYHLEMAPPSPSDFTDDFERVRRELADEYGVTCQRGDIEVLRELSLKLREWDWSLKAILRDGELVAVLPHHVRHLGLAFDLGTTKIAGYLVDLATGKTLAARGIMNPQIAYGDDIISRLTRVRRDSAEAERMQQLVAGAIDHLTSEMCAEVAVSPAQIVEAVGVANSAMHHLFLRLPIGQLVVAPFIPAVGGALDVKARDLGLHLASGAYVHILPNIAGFIGADHVAMILATGVWQMPGLVLALDIGTNTEICLANNGEMSSISTASGPAFEGAHIKYGMRAAPGAIEHVRLEQGRFEYDTIGGGEAVGICGSGILDIVAQLYLAGIVNRGGRLGDHERVRQGIYGREFVLVGNEDNNGDNSKAITITQQDIREVQLAKGAIRAGINLLLESAGREEQEIKQIIIAGAFGSYIDPMSAVAIGMLPSLPVERFKQVGNAAGAGARLALISRKHRTLAEDIAHRVRYIEPSNLPGFTKVFARAIYLD